MRSKMGDGEVKQVVLDCMGNVLVGIFEERERERETMICKRF